MIRKSACDSVFIDRLVLVQGPSVIKSINETVLSSPKTVRSSPIEFQKNDA